MISCSCMFFWAFEEEAKRIESKRRTIFKGQTFFLEYCNVGFFGSSKKLKKLVSTVNKRFLQNYCLSFECLFRVRKLWTSEWKIWMEAMIHGQIAAGCWTPVRWLDCDGCLCSLSWVEHSVFMISFRLQRWRTNRLQNIRSSSLEQEFEASDMLVPHSTSFLGLLDCSDIARPKPSSELTGTHSRLHIQGILGLDLVFMM